MFELTSLRSDTSAKPLPPFINSLIDDVLTKYRPNLNQTFFQLHHVVYTLLIHPLLKITPNFVID